MPEWELIDGVVAVWLLFGGVTYVPELILLDFSMFPQPIGMDAEMLSFRLPWLLSKSKGESDRSCSAASAHQKLFVRSVFKVEG